MKKAANRPQPNPEQPHDGGPTQTVSFLVDGEPATAPAGQSLAAALHQQGYAWWRRNPVTGQPRGPFCGMGICFECELTVDGQPQRACLTHVTDAMVVTTERGRCAPDVH